MKTVARTKRGLTAAFACMAAAFACMAAADAANMRELEDGFAAPPKTARPGVYWYFMDGNYSREGVTRDVEAMREAGIGYAVFLEVNVGIPRGKVEMLSDEWLAMFKHIVDECERCDIQLILGIGPGWTGSGGPWVKPERSMRHLVSSSRDVEGGGRVSVKLDKPAPHRPFFGEHQFPPKMKKEWREYCKDVCVLAFPAQGKDAPKIENIDEKALVCRAPYSSPQLSPTGRVRPDMGASVAASGRDKALAKRGIDKKSIIDISDKMSPDGTLEWDAPTGRWTVMRFCERNNGAVTRPAPAPGVGMECDKFDDKALEAHLAAFTDKLYAAIGPRKRNVFGGIKYLHLDSWEMGAQNWTDKFREEFAARRGYDPKPFYPVYAGLVVDSVETSERFLWDLRRTSQELIIEKHVGAVKRYAKERGCEVSCEPYDMNPTADLELAAASDMPMAEFWTEGFGTDTSYAPVEAASVAHLIGQSVVPAESFTAHRDAWRPHPGSMKNQTDWALAAGVNRLVFHTFQHQPLAEDKKPGMTMGPYGVHWDRNQTWWPMVGDGYHAYLARCQFMLQQGRTVADVLYLAPENAPHVFLAPESAFDAPRPRLPDRKGHNFDGCPPSLLFKASVENGEIVFPGGARYRLLVLPQYATMTPGLLRKIRNLAAAGATVAGMPPVAAPGLTDWPKCDEEVREIAKELWGEGEEAVRRFGLGRVVRMAGPDRLYPEYGKTAALLEGDGVLPDFESSTGNQRYTHRAGDGFDIYFVASRSDKAESARCTFRTSGGTPEVWDPLTGERRSAEFSDDGKRTTVALDFAPHQAFFVVFGGKAQSGAENAKAAGKTPPARAKAGEKSVEIGGPWKVEFRPPAGEKFSATFDKLEDWTANKKYAIKYFSGIASYETEFDCPGATEAAEAKLETGKANVMARVWLNGRDLGVLWTGPWSVDATGILKEKGNKLKIEVANLWTNRLVGDERDPQHRKAFATWRHYGANSSLEPSGLEGPCRVRLAPPAGPCTDIRFKQMPQQMLFGDTLRKGRPFAKDPTVIKHDGRYLMYYSVWNYDRDRMPPKGMLPRGGNCWTGAVAESRDLVNWTYVGDIKTAGGDTGEECVAPCVKKIDGKIHMFAQCRRAKRRPGERRAAIHIWHATSEDGVNFKYVENKPMFEPRNKWSVDRAIDAEVYRTGDRLMLMYATRERPGDSVQRLGMAWAPYDSDWKADKWTELSLDAPFFEPRLPWEMKCIEAPTVIKRKGIWYMFYAGAYNHERQQIGVAWSKDGVNFTRWSDAPVLTHGPKGAWNEWESGHPGVFEDEDGRVYLFYQGKASLHGDYRLSCLEVVFVD